MGAGCVAGVTRAKAMLSRCLGVSGARDVAAFPTLDEAVRYLGTTPYRRFLEAEAPLAEAQRAATCALLWHLRVLAGWQPRAGAGAVRLLAAGFEIANVDDHMRSLSGADTPLPYRLGGLATAWPRLAKARTHAEVRATLTASAWGDPGGESPAAVAVGMRIAAAARTASAVPSAGRWTAGRTALLVAREVFVNQRRLTEPSERRAARLLGWQALRATSFPHFRRHLPEAVRWAMDGIDTEADLWRAETRWWTQFERDGSALVHSARLDVTPVVGAVAVLSTDAWRVRAALELAARGGRPMEALDVLV